MSFFDTPETNSISDEDRFTAEDNIGKLILFSPESYEKDFPTTNGTKDVVKTHLVVFDGTTATEYPDTLIFQGYLIGALKAKAKQGSGKVLARLAKGQPKQKGWKAPFILTEPSAEDKATATAWIEKNSDPFSI